jgi:hypothetical protein
MTMRSFHLALLVVTLTLAVQSTNAWSHSAPLHGSFGAAARTNVAQNRSPPNSVTPPRAVMVTVLPASENSGNQVGERSREPNRKLTVDTDSSNFGNDQATLSFQSDIAELVYARSLERGFA